MFGSRDSSTTETDDRRDGPSLARGPAWIAGLALSEFGLAMFFRSTGTPLSTAGFPDGAATGGTFLGIETNAWTAWGTTAAGILVLMGAAQHALAKTMSLLAGLVLGAAAILAIIDGDVLGLAAANEWTIVGWGAAAGVLLVTALLPRIGRRHDERDTVAESDRARARDERVMATSGTTGGSRKGGMAPATTTDERVAPGEARSEPLRRTYRETPGTVTDDEVAAARRAESQSTTRRS